MGDLFDQLGVSRIAGRLLAVLLVCEPPEMTANDLAAAAQASAGSVSTQLRLLVRLGLVRRQGRIGSRQYLYRIDPGAWSELLNARLRMVSRFRELAELGLESVGETASQQERLVAMRDFYAFFEREVEAVIHRYLERRQETGEE